MRSIVFSTLLTSSLAAPAIAETLICTFDVTERHRDWVPAQITLIRDRDYGRDKVSAEIFRKSGKPFIPAKLMLSTDERIRLGFQNIDPSVTNVGGYARRDVGSARYSLTIYSDERPALLKATTKPETLGWSNLKVRFKGECKKK
ncbi:hypothetical protein [Aliiroseovarius crassostreae]|uniref:hypothetical protein n=1 Tax=Aliiroseovarius crassostreae TaxID=154981 RepID=UPI0021FBA60E|nr:hypothetical protein [Aliiroseovarius crassostreae]UWQ03602.1 hypothetical protein K3X22_07650 [Aliiroseovarius crassostreae]